MRILGIDPGSHVTGYGVVDRDGARLIHVAHGTLRSRRGEPMPRRLAALAAGLRCVIATHRPDVAVVERVFVAASPRSALALGQARGVALLAMANAELEIHEYTPLEVKQAVVGYGRATKVQVQEMVKVLLGLDSVPQPDDAADAIAVAICHIHSARMKSLARKAEEIEGR